MQERRPMGSGVVLLGGERPCSNRNNRKIQANAAMRKRLQWHLRMWPWSVSDSGNRKRRYALTVSA